MINLLQNCVESIRENYRKDYLSKEMVVRQRAVALYFIDKLALRAGNEKDDDEADTVGCCSLRVEHISKLILTGLKDNIHLHIQHLGYISRQPRSQRGAQWSKRPCHDDIGMT